MLVLRRKLGERIVLRHEQVPGDVVIEIVRLARGRVTFGVTADDSVRIVRSELLAGGDRGDRGDRGDPVDGMFDGVDGEIDLVG